MKYKNDKFEITGSPAEINEFLHFAQMNDKQDEINAQQQRIKELALSNTQLRDHEEKLIEHLNKITAEKTTLLSEKVRYEELALTREQELKSYKDDLIRSQIDHKNILEELAELERVSSVTKEHNYKLRKKIEELTEELEKNSSQACEHKDSTQKGITDKLLIARDRELDYLAELNYQERHHGETDEQFRKRILEELTEESEG